MSKVRVLIWLRISALHKDTSAGFGGDWTLPSLLVLSPLEPSSEAEFILQIAGYPRGPRPWRSSLQDWSGWALHPVRNIPGIQTGNRPTNQLGSLSGLQPTAACSLLLTGIDRADGANHHLRDFFCCVAWFPMEIPVLPASDPETPLPGGISKCLAEDEITSTWQNKPPRPSSSNSSNNNNTERRKEHGLTGSEGNLSLELASPSLLHHPDFP